MPICICARNGMLFVSIHRRSSSQKVTSCQARKYSRGWTAAPMCLKPRPWLCCRPAVWPWTSYVIPLWMSVLDWTWHSCESGAGQVSGGSLCYSEHFQRVIVMGSSPHPHCACVVCCVLLRAGETGHTRVCCPHPCCLNHRQPIITYTLAKKGKRRELLRNGTWDPKISHLGMTNWKVWAAVGKLLRPWTQTLLMVRLMTSHCE